MAKRKPAGKPKGKSAKKKATAAKAPGIDAIRPGGTVVQVFNSGLEVWLYDDANVEAIRSAKGKDPGAGGMPPNFHAQTKKGLVVGYSLYQDDGVWCAVFEGKPFTEQELSAARWLEPQTALLKLPSGKLCIESNDASRIGPEYDPKHVEKGGRVDVAPGDYKLTLYRIDHEALDREGLRWDGPQELVVLTPGGKAKDAAGDLLPFEHRRDLTWVGKYRVEGTRAEALVWFDDYWDSFTLNLDEAAQKKLGLKPGTYFRTTVADAKLALLSVFANSWDDGRRLPPPEGQPLDEFGYASPLKRGDWANAQVLFCRREKAKTRAEDEHKKIWLPATVELLDAKPMERAAGVAPAQLAEKEYFDPSFLGLILSEVLPEAEDMDELLLPKALELLDKHFAKLKLAPKGDRSALQGQGANEMEICLRFYLGLPDRMAVILASAGWFELFFLSELADGTWAMTGMCDDMERLIKRTDAKGLYVPNPKVRFESLDAPLPEIHAAHQAALKGAKPKPAPQEIDAAVSAFERFSEAAFK
ncbi:MAG: hypothetical protein L6R28_25075 [Planctomycetes bacterium]|nr:hypothetical protein [Planctomycetota bacterium]